MRLGIVDNLKESCSHMVGKDEEELFDEELPLDIAFDEGPIDLDDGNATELEIGVSLGDLEEEPEEAGPELNLDLTGLLNVDDASTSLDDDETGPARLEVSVGLQELPSEDLDDTALGLGDDSPLSGPLTPMAPADDGDEGTLDTFTLEIADESPLPADRVRWEVAARRAGDVETLETLAGRVFVAGTPCRFEQAGRSDLAPLSAVQSIALVEHPEGHTMVVAATKLSSLLRLPFGSTQSPEAFDWQGVAGLPPGAPTTAWVKAFPGHHEVLVLCPSTALLSLGMEELKRVQISGVPLALPEVADHPTLLAEGSASLVLLESESVRGPYRQHALPKQIANAWHVGGCRFVVHGTTVAFGSSEHGVLLSTDMGRRFSPVAGTAAMSSLTIGTLGGRTIIWATLMREVAGESELISIDPSGGATSLARFQTVADDESFAPVTTLRQDAAEGVILAAGEFGLVRLRPTS